MNFHALENVIGFTDLGLEQLILYQQLILYYLTYFVSIFDLFRITNLFCSKIALVCIAWPTYFVPTLDLICYKTVRRILARFQGDTK